VTVFIHIDPGGQRAASYASWIPPVLARSGSGGLDQPDLALLLGYNQSSSAGIGERDLASVSASVFSPLRQRVSRTELQARLNRYSLQARFDGGAPVGLSFAKLMSPAPQDLPGTAIRYAELALPSPAPREVELSLLDPAHQTAVSIRYDVGTVITRDKLFAQAWQQAENMATNPASCALTADAAQAPLPVELDVP
jgi:hypothetical protein